MPDDRPVVVASHRMTDEQFAKHWNMRHMGQDTPDHVIPFGEGKTDNVTAIKKLYRTFHDTLHRLEVGIRYDHRHTH